MFRERLAATARPTNLIERHTRTEGKLPEPSPDRARRNPRGPEHRRYAAIAGGLRLRRRKHAATSLVQMRRQRQEPLADRILINHSLSIGPNTPPRESSHNVFQSRRDSTNS